MKRGSGDAVRDGDERRVAEGGHLALALRRPVAAVQAVDDRQNEGAKTRLRFPDLQIEG